MTGGGVQVHLQVDQPQLMDACLVPLRRMTSLLVLSVAVGAFILDERQMSQLGDLPVRDLRLISQNYKKNPTLPRPCCSHLDNAGVKAYVDAVCRRCVPPPTAALLLCPGRVRAAALLMRGVNPVAQAWPWRSARSAVSGEKRERRGRVGFSCSVSASRQVP